MSTKALVTKLLNIFNSPKKGFNKLSPRVLNNVSLSYPIQLNVLKAAYSCNKSENLDLWKVSTDQIVIPKEQIAKYQ